MTGYGDSNKFRFSVAEIFSTVAAAWGYRIGEMAQAQEAVRRDDKVDWMRSKVVDFDPFAPGSIATLSWQSGGQDNPGNIPPDNAFPRY